MAAIGMALVWAGYAAGLYGYSLIRGYCNTPAGLLNPLHPQPWSTTVYTGTGVIPSGCAGQKPAAAPGGQGANAANPQGGAVLSGSPQPGVQGVVAGGHGR